jgi:hypothetical protein
VLNFADGTPFTTGRAKYLDQSAQAGEGSAKIFVRIEPQGFGGLLLAQLDTGAPWSVLNAEIADTLGLLGGDGEQIKIHTRDGTFDGRLEEATLTILAHDGESVAINARVFVSREWQGQTFLGYMGLLEKIRFALDPQENYFYFGSY